MFRPFLKILWSWMLTSLLHESLFWPAGPALTEVKRPKIEIFKVHDIDTVIQPREKTHQTHLSSVLEKFFDHMRSL